MSEAIDEWWRENAMLSVSKDPRDYVIGYANATALFEAALQRGRELERTEFLKRDTDCVTVDDWKHKAMHYEAEWRRCSDFANSAIQRARELATPEGWQLVPTNPTTAMWFAGQDYATYPNDTGELICMAGQQVEVIYKAMLAAAPTLENKHG